MACPMSVDAKLQFLAKERRSLGQTALCLSGGGSICMYHMGTIKALIEAGIFKSIRFSKRLESFV